MTRDGEWPRLRSEVRLADADRERAIVRLSEHYAAGRLDKDEFDERSDAVWTARTAGDVEPVFADLEPATLERREPRPPARGARRGRLPVPFLPMLFVLIALTAVIHLPLVLFAFVGWAFLIGRRRGRGCW